MSGDHADVLLRRRVLVVDDALRNPHTAVGRSVRGLVTELARRGVEVTESVSYEDGAAVVASDAGLCAVLVDWDLVNGAAARYEAGAGHAAGPGYVGGTVPGGAASRLMSAIRARNATLPIFLLAKGDAEREFTVEALEHADELVWVLQDTAEFIAGRVLAAMDRYVSGLLPPFFKALLEYNREQEYAWAVPGHQGGVAYLKTPVGRMFHDFYGENLFRTDMGIERVSLGSLLDHTGPVGESEAYAARVFGAHRSYSGLVGTSGSNRTVMSGVLGSGDVAVIDRNCHKSVMQGLQITGAVPVYLIPSRNRYGIIGPIRPAEMTADAIAQKIQSSPLANDNSKMPPAGEASGATEGGPRGEASVDGSAARAGDFRAEAPRGGARDERSFERSGEPRRVPVLSGDPPGEPDSTDGGPAPGGSGGLVCAPQESSAPQYVVITNCTYDGLCYDVEAAERLLAPSSDVLHFDEAWYGYARFHPLYAGRFAMRGDPADHPGDGPTVFSTQSSHKLLAALSQASFIHIREGRRKVPHAAFNEAYMMHATTSPLYPLIAANDVATSMMDGPGGRALIQETIDEAVAFRQSLARAHRQFAERGEWFFAPWNAPEVTDPASGTRVPFADAPASLLTREPACWVLHPDESWHGFDGVEDGWCMLDPTKAGIIAPGMREDGDLEARGVPAPLLTAYLGRHGIVPSRTTDHIVLCLFSVGITRGKWGTLLNALLAFKRDWDANTPLAAVLPDLLAVSRDRYGGKGLRDVGEQMWDHLRRARPGAALQAAFASLPAPRITPRAAYEELVAGRAELVPFAEMAGRTLAVGLQPYPPGIPILLPGEDAGPADGPFLSYLRMLTEWDAAFPGFEHEIEGAVHGGAEHADDQYAAYCVR